MARRPWSTWHSEHVSERGQGEHVCRQFLDVQGASINNTELQSEGGIPVPCKILPIKTKRKGPPWTTVVTSPLSKTWYPLPPSPLLEPVGHRVSAGNTMGDKQAHGQA